MPSSRVPGAVVDSDTEMFSKARLRPRNSVRALCVCVAIAVFGAIHQHALAGTDTWADITDVTQYVPLAWATVRTFHAEDAQGAFQLASAGITTLVSADLLKRAINERRPNYRPGDGRNSFPSGHVAKAWFAAAYLQRRYGCYELEAAAGASLRFRIWRPSSRRPAASAPAGITSWTWSRAPSSPRYGSGTRWTDWTATC